MWLKIPRGCSYVLAFALFFGFAGLGMNVVAQQTRAKELLQEHLKDQRSRLQNGTVMLILRRDANSTTHGFLYLIAFLDDKMRCESYVVPRDFSPDSKEEIGFIFQENSGLFVNLVVSYSDGYYSNVQGAISIGRSTTISNPIAYYRFLDAVINSLDFRDVQIQKHDAPDPYVGVNIRQSDWYQLSKDTDQCVEFTTDISLDPEHAGLATRLAGTRPELCKDPQKGEDAPRYVVYFTWQAEVMAFAKSHGIWYPQIVMTKEEMEPDAPPQEDRWEVLGFCTGVDLPISIFGSSPNRKMKTDSAWLQVSEWIVLNPLQQPIDKIKEEK